MAGLLQKMLLERLKIHTFDLQNGFDHVNGPLGDFNRMLDRYLTPAVKMILLTNVFVHVLFVFAGASDPAAVDRLRWFLGEVPARSWYQPWRFVTYMFLHADIFHLGFNMLVFFFFAPPLENRWGTRTFWRFYLIVGAGAGIIHCLLTNLSFYVFQGSVESMIKPVIGASGAIYGVMLAFAAYYPEQVVLLWGVLPMKIKQLMPAIILIDLAISTGMVRTHISSLTHLAGLVVAYVLLAIMHKDWDLRTWRWR